MTVPLNLRQHCILSYDRPSKPTAHFVFYASFPTPLYSNKCKSSLMPLPLNLYYMCSLSDSRPSKIRHDFCKLEKLTAESIWQVITLES